MEKHKKKFIESLKILKGKDVSAKKIGKKIRMSFDQAANYLLTNNPSNVSEKKDN